MMSVSFDLTRLRRSAQTMVACVLWAQPLLTAIVCSALGRSWLLPVGASLALAAGAQIFTVLDHTGDRARVAAGVALMAAISILIGVAQGAALQVDLHMAYFAALAILLASCDWRVIVAGAATVALHHTILNFVLPELIYPGGADLLRLAVHASILIVEASVLAWVGVTLERMFDVVAEETRRSEAARLLAEENHAAAIASSDHARLTESAHEMERRRVAEEDALILTRTADALRLLSEGDLTAGLHGALPAKAEALRAHLAKTVESLGAVMQAITQVTGTVAESSDEISRASEDLSRRTETQAAALEETSATLNEITETVRSTSNKASHARTVVSETKSEAEQSCDVVRVAIQAMEGIDQSSKQIGQIISIIDEIAFQTNLLALNAGVEAARAGDSGRGFAVVAQEVRALAQRSAEAAKEIKALVSTSAERVAQGVDLVAQTGAALERIVAQVSAMDGVVREIAGSAQDQAVALGQVNVAVTEIGRVTQQNAAMVEQSTAASHALIAETDKLAELLGHFRMRESAVVAPRRSARRVA